MSSNSASPSTPTKSSPTSGTRPNRLPAPTLFVGPPSRNASQLSISRPAADSHLTARRDPLNRGKSALSRQQTVDDVNSPNKDGTTIPLLAKPSDKAIDARWREMQSTLNDVELTAQSSTHVFGTQHAAALEELRRAQIELARAWGRGNEEKATAAGNDAAELNVNRFQGADERIRRNRGDTQTSTSTALSDESGESGDGRRSVGTTSMHGSGGSGGAGSHMGEDETAQDIRLASERRAANEAYFKSVDEGVKDVVARLEVVAEAMRGVEAESRSLWSASERSSTESGGAGGVGGAKEKATASAG